MIDDDTITVISSKKMKLLAYLILECDFPQSRRKIAFDFWPESVEKQALSNLRKLIHELRGYHPQIDRFLKITSEYLMWKDEWPFCSDVREFEQLSQGQTLYELRKAEELYRGELLPGFYEEWLHSKREKLAQMHVKVLEKLVFQLENQKEYSTAIVFARKLLLHNQLNEEYYRILMRLHAMNKDAVGIVTTYEQLQFFLGNEFGIAPDEESLQLYRRLTQVRTKHSNELITETSQPFFIGRIDEWGNIMRVWNQATTGHASLLVLKGEAGIGKTRLAQEFKLWADSQGIHSAISGCYPSVRTLSYTPVTSWLRSFPFPQMNVMGLSELVRLLPELYDTYPDLPEPTPIQENWQLNKWYEAIEQMLVTRQPLLLILDDIQWCDKDSIRFISYLLRSDSTAKLLVIATMRSGESENDAVVRMYSDLQMEGKLTEIELAPLNKDDTRRLMTASVGTSPVDVMLSEWYAVTGGNPLFIVEMLKEWQTGNDPIEFRQSSLVKTVIKKRLNRMLESRELLAAVAAVGRPVSTQLIALIIDENEEMVQGRIEVLVHLKVIQETTDGKYEFTHDVVKGIAYELIKMSSRRQCHQRIALALIASHNEQLETNAGEIAFHFELAGMAQEALPYYEMSALEAEKKYAHESMIHDYRKICSLLPPVKQLPYLLKIGESLTTLGDWNGAERTYRNWLDSFGYSVSIRERSFCDVALGNCLRLQGKYEEARFHLERALRHFEWIEDLSGRSLVYGTLGILHYVWGNYDQSLYYLMERIELPDADNRTKRNCRFFGYIGFLYYDQCEYDQAILWFKKQIMLASEIGDSHAISEAMGGLTLVYLDTDELELAFDHIVEKMEISKSIGDRMEFATAIGMLGKYYLYQGHRKYATRCIAYCLEEAVMIKDWRIAAIVLGLEGRNLMEQHQYEEADQMIERALRIFRKLRILYFTCETLYDVSLLRLRQRRLDLARTAANEALNLANRLQRKDMQFKLPSLLMQLQTDACPITSSVSANVLHRMNVINEAAEARPLPKQSIEVTRTKAITQKMLNDIDLYLMD